MVFNDRLPRKGITEIIKARLTHWAIVRKEFRGIIKSDSISYWKAFMYVGTWKAAKRKNLLIGVVQYWWLKNQH